MAIRETMYGLIHQNTGRLMTVEISGTGTDEFCNDYESCLSTDEGDNTLFLVRTLEDALRVIESPIDWYKSGQAYPHLGNLRAEHIKVVPVTIEF